ncbi:MAG: hypothetical protein KDF63_03830, partial [Rhodoferax sp.]|nr:hypothetical protein [Rhodoferax sp.]
MGCTECQASNWPWLTSRTSRSILAAAARFARLTSLARSQPSPKFSAAGALHPEVHMADIKNYTLNFGPQHPA